MKKRTITALIIALAVAAALLWAMPFGGRPSLLDLLPEGQWFQFHGGSGSQELRMPLGSILNTSRPDLYEVPEGLSYCTPDEVRKVLKNLSPEPMEPTQRLLDLSFLVRSSVMNESLRLPEHTGVERFFAFGFRDSAGESWELWFLQEGVTMLLTTSDEPNRFFRDNGECYAAMKEAFGDDQDWDLRPESTVTPDLPDLIQFTQPVQLLDLLPEGYWFGFRGGVGGQDKDGRYVTPDATVLDTARPDRYRVPARIQTYDAPHVRKALEGRQIRPVPRDEYPTQIEPPWRDPAFAGCKGYFTFQVKDAQGSFIMLNILDNGYVLVAIKAPDGQTVADALFQDGGECYRALKKHFGDLSDMERWEIALP